MKNYEDAIEFDALYDSIYRCRRGTSWKPSTKHFTLYGIKNCINMEESLKNGSYKHGKSHPIKINYPKKRVGSSICFKDRVYQRSLNDNILYPVITNSFIYDNAACQKGKGTDFARKRIKKHLWNFYTHYGNEGYALHIDIKGYYKHIKHSIAIDILRKHLPQSVFSKVVDILNAQYPGEIGFTPGSQLIQLIGITFLNSLDHYIKESLHQRYYVRYMDDLLILSNSKEELETLLNHIKSHLKSLELSVHTRKTRIFALRKGFTFLGFKHRLTESGKVIASINGKNVKHEKQKLRRMVKKMRIGLVSVEKIEECYRSWKSHASKGNSYLLLKKMDKYYKSLMEANYAEAYSQNKVA